MEATQTIFNPVIYQDELFADTIDAGRIVVGFDPETDQYEGQIIPAPNNGERWFFTFSLPPAFAGQDESDEPHLMEAAQVAYSIYATRGA